MISTTRDQTFFLRYRSSIQRISLNLFPVQSPPEDLEHAKKYLHAEQLGNKGERWVRAET